MEMSVATQPGDDEPLELTEVVDPDEPEQPDDEQNPETNDDDDDGEETVVQFDDEEDAKPDDNSVIREFRRREREKDKRIKELESQVAPKPIEVGEKPTLAGCEYDEDRYDRERDEWQERKTAAERQQQTQAEQVRAANEAWQQDLAQYEAKKAGLSFADRDDAIDTAITSLDKVQQAVIIKALAQVGGDPALFLYAVGKSDAKRAKLAKIQDPIKLAAAVARMEGGVKVTKGRRAPEPDRPLRGSAPMPGGADKRLEQLNKEASRTGDFTKVIAYEKQQAKK